MHIHIWLTVFSLAPWERRQVNMAQSAQRYLKPVWCLFKDLNQKNLLVLRFWNRFSFYNKTHSTTDFSTHVHTRTSMVGSYSSTKWFWMSCIVSALLPTPPAPTTTSLYSVMIYLWGKKKKKINQQCSSFCSKLSAGSFAFSSKKCRSLTVWTVFSQCLFLK